MKFNRLKISLLVFLCIFISNANGTSKLRLVAPQFPPYTSEKDGIFSGIGIGIDLIEKVMKDISVDYQLRSTPNYARALGEIVRGQADGFFSCFRKYPTK